MPETPITVVGNLTADPELRYTPSGTAVANFTIASTPRYFDKQAGSWKDNEALFQRCQVWEQHAEHVSETLGKGSRVLAHGRLRSRTFQTRNGENRTNVELIVDEIGPCLRYATATVNKVQRSQAQQTEPAPSGSGDPWSRPATEEAPF